MTNAVLKTEQWLSKEKVTAQAFGDAEGIYFAEKNFLRKLSKVLSLLGKLHQSPQAVTMLLLIPH